MSDPTINHDDPWAVLAPEPVKPVEEIISKPNALVPKKVRRLSKGKKTPITAPEAAPKQAITPVSTSTPTTTGIINDSRLVPAPTGLNGLPLSKKGIKRAASTAKISRPAPSSISPQRLAGNVDLAQDQRGLPLSKKAIKKSRSKQSFGSKYDTFDVLGVPKEADQTDRDRKNAKKIDVVSAAKAFRQLAMMLSVDKNEIAPLDRVAKQYTGTSIGTVFAKMRTDMADNNLSFSAAFSKHGKLFPKVVTGLVSIGAQAGREGDALVKAAIIIQDNAKTGRRVKSAISEPLFTLGLTVTFLFVVLFGIIPQFKAVFDALGKPLPFLSQLLMNISIGTGWFLGAFIIVTVIWIIYWKKNGQYNEELRVKFDTFKLNMKPKVFGELIQTGLMFQLFNNLAILREINMNERNTIVTAARSTSNYALRKHLLLHARRMEDGEAVFGELANEPKIFPPDSGYMLMVGEDSGKGTMVLKDMALNYKEEAGLAADQFVAQIGPIANTAVGMVYMFVMLASYLPIFEMYTNISGS